ncbi:MAG: M48 family metallopeptidase, partial [Desulfobulbales bacterium]
MKPELLALLLLYLGVKAAEQLLLRLNLRHLSRHGAEVPPGFAEYIDSATLRKMRDYTVAHGQVDTLEALFSTGITLFFFFGGLLNWLNNLIAGQAWQPLISGILFYLILIYADTVITIPFSLYNTFSLEKRFGFTRQTLGLWVRDLLKSLLINTIILVLLLCGILALISVLPDKWWLAAWAFVLLFT